MVARAAAARSAQPLKSVARPKQTRSEATLYRILDAAESLIEEKSLADASIPEIVRRAGSSVGGFYARFKDKNELLRALEERFFQELALRVERISDTERWIRAEIPEIVSACVAELISVARARHNLILAFVARSVHDEEFREEALRFRRRVSERISNVLYPRRDQLRHPDPELAIDLGVQFALSLVFQRTVTGETQAGGRTLSDAELGREIERSFLSYVGFAGVVSAP